MQCLGKRRNYIIIQDVTESDDANFGDWACQDGHCWPGTDNADLLRQVDQIHRVKSSTCKNVFELPAPDATEELPFLINAIKDRIREMAIDDVQTGPQDRYAFYEGDPLDDRQRQCKKYMAKVNNHIDIYLVSLLLVD